VNFGSYKFSFVGSLRRAASVEENIYMTEMCKNTQRCCKESTWKSINAFLHLSL